MNAKLIFAPLVLVAVLTGGYFIDRSRTQKQSLLSGYFESQPSLIASRLGGRVEKILIKEGDFVKAGQPLIKLEANSAEASYQALLQGANQAQQQYIETVRGSRHEDIASGEAALAEAQANFDRLKNGPRPEEIRAARAKFKLAKSQYDKATAGSRSEDKASSRAAAEQALWKLRQAQAGFTAEEQAQLKARLDSAEASELVAKKQLNRTQTLAEEGAVPKAQLDRDLAIFMQAAAARRDAEEGFSRGQKGTRPEEIAQAKAAYDQARAQRDLVLRGSRKEDIDAARQDMLAAFENLRIIELGSRPEDIRAAHARLEQAQIALVKLRNGNRPEDVAKAKSAAQQAQLQAKSTQENLKERVVFAATDGIIDRVLVADGDLVAMGTPVAQLGNPNDIWLRVYLPESEIPKVKVGDSVDLVFDGITGIVKGLVESIATKGEFTPANLQSPDERAKQVFAVRIRLAKPDSRVKAGMYATAKKVGRWP